MNKRLTFLLPIALLSACSFTGKTNGISKNYGSYDTKTVDGITVPVFKGDKKVTLTAYAVPRIGYLVNETNQAEIDRNKATEARNNSVLSKVKEMKFDKIIPLFDGRDGTLSDVTLKYTNYIADRTNTTKRLELKNAIKANAAAVKAKNLYGIKKAQQYGLEYLAINEMMMDHFNVYQNATLEDYKLMVETYIDCLDYDDTPGYAGTLFCDEPFGEAKFDKLAVGAKYYKKKGHTKDLAINLLPLSIGAAYDYDSYKSYVQMYMEKVYPYTNYLSFDIYPIKNRSLEYWHLLDMEIITQELKKANTGGDWKIFMDCPSKDTWDGTTKIESTDFLRLKAYSALAYGVSEISYYELSYEGDGNGLDGTNYVFNYKDPTIVTPVFDNIKEMNTEINTFSNVVRNFDYKNTIVSGYSDSFLQLQHTVNSYNSLKKVSEVNENPTLVGCFSREGADGYMVVNYQNPAANLTYRNSKVNLEFDSKYDHVLVYQNGTEKCYSTNKGKYALDIQGTSGAFVIPLDLE